jgi:hypothetical protein
MRPFRIIETSRLGRAWLFQHQPAPHDASMAAAAIAAKSLPNATPPTKQSIAS